MSIHEALEVLGGVASRHQLIRLTSRAEVDAALAAGAVCVAAHGRYASPGVDRARLAAHRLSGATCLLSAALAHGWSVKTEPVHPQVVVARNRKVTALQRRGVDLRRADLGPDDVRDGVTTRSRTLADCGRWLPYDEALAVFDSALRSGVPLHQLQVIARDVRGPGSRQVRSLARAASPVAANPFESVLRAIAMEIEGLRVRPQVPLWSDEFLGRPDLVDEELKVVLEADSFAWHGGRRALAQDARRYNRLVVAGWMVLRFAWEDVMTDQPYVREILRAAVAERTQRPGSGALSA